MKRLLLVLGLLASFAGRSRTQEPTPDPHAGKIVDCGTDKTVIFEDTTSKDDRFALAWTIRPHKRQAPVNWSALPHNDAREWLEALDMSDPPSPKDRYEMFIGVLDIQAKKFTQLPTRHPDIFFQNHGEILVEWSEDHGGARRAMIDNDGRWSTTNLWLAEIGPGGTQVLELTAPVNKAIAAWLRGQQPKHLKDYVTNLGNQGEVQLGQPYPPKFEATAVNVPFEAHLPKDMDGPSYLGNIRVSLPGRTVGQVTGKRVD